MKHSLFILLACLLALLVGCPADSPSSPIALAGVRVSGAGIAAVNGFYIRANETHNGAPYYSLAVGSTTYYLFAETPDGYQWYISDNLGAADASEALYSSDYYNTSAALPCHTVWTDQTGEGDPPPTVLAEISSDNDWGGELRSNMDTIQAEYQFVDLDGELEGETTFQWYRVDPGTGLATMIDGATSRSYALVYPDDDGYGIQVVVTPVSESGITGASVIIGPTVTTTNNM